MGYLKYEILERQTKVAQRAKHAIPCHAYRGENQQCARGKDNRPALLAKNRYYSELKATFDQYLACLLLRLHEIQTFSDYFSKQNSKSSCFERPKTDSICKL